MVGVWRAIRFAEFRRAVAEERARVAREIHDGLAQYLFAVSTHATMLEAGTAPDVAIPKLKAAAAAAQQEAQFAPCSRLSSAGGTALFDAALRRYVDFVTADGALDVDLEIDAGTVLAPDEQIEVFRIVQEGLAKCVRARGRTACRGPDRRAARPPGRDDWGRRRRLRGPWRPRPGWACRTCVGARRRSLADSALRSRPGHGTAVEVVLRA